MGDTDYWLQHYGEVPSFEVLFDDPEGREDALEAVKMLKSDVDVLHVRKILWEAHREWNLARDWRDYPRKVQKLVNALHVVNTALNPPPPYLLDLERQILKARPRSGKKGGRPTLLFYRKAVRGLSSIGVTDQLAKTMLRGFGLKFGPAPKS